MSALSERVIWEHMRDDGSLHDLLADIPDDLHQETIDGWYRLDAAALRIEERAQRLHNDIFQQMQPGWTRDDYETRAAGWGGLTPLLIAILDGRDTWPLILDSLKPAGETP